MIGQKAPAPIQGRTGAADVPAAIGRPAREGRLMRTKTYADHMRDLLVADGGSFVIEYGDAALLDACYYRLHRDQLKEGVRTPQYQERWKRVLAGLKRSRMFEGLTRTADRFTSRGPARSFHVVYRLREEFR